LGNERLKIEKKNLTGKHEGGSMLESDDNYTTLLRKNGNGRNIGGAFFYPCAPFLFGEPE
jgi:hypothetical protein